MDTKLQPLGGSEMCILLLLLDNCITSVTDIMQLSNNNNNMHISIPP